MGPAKTVFLQISRAPALNVPCFYSLTPGAPLLSGSYHHYHSASSETAFLCALINVCLLGGAQEWVHLMKHCYSSLRGPEETASLLCCWFRMGCKHLIDLRSIFHSTFQGILVRFGTVHDYFLTSLSGSWKKNKAVWSLFTSEMRLN